MADCNRQRFPRQWEKLRKVNGLNTPEEIAELICEIMCKDQRKSINELAKIVASPQQRNFTENDFNELSDPANAEIVKKILREYERSKPNEDLPHYLMRKAMDERAFEIIHQLRVSNFNGCNQELKEGITQACPIVSDKNAILADSILETGKLTRQPKQKHIDVNSFLLN